MDQPESLLPASILARATLRGTEYAWPVEYIPKVIQAARVARLLNIGGQLQLRLPDGATCEAYWVEVDTFRAAPSGRTWQEKVSWSAREALEQLQSLQERYDFEAECLEAFPGVCADLASDGGNLCEALCFAWYVEAEPAK